MHSAPVCCWLRGAGDRAGFGYHHEDSPHLDPGPVILRHEAEGVLKP